MTEPRPEPLTLRYDHSVRRCGETVGVLLVTRKQKPPRQAEGIAPRHRRTLRLVDNSTEGVT
jgi:hypothetical protein